MGEIKTPVTHPDHPVVGHYFKAWAGPNVPGNAIYYCDSFDPAVDFWMSPVTRKVDGAVRTAVSPRAIDRTFHTVWEDFGRMSCNWGPLSQVEVDCIIEHRAKLAEQRAVANG